VEYESQSGESGESAREHADRLHDLLLDHHGHSVIQHALSQVRGQTLVEAPETL
jgi:hypothetical protein